MSFADEIKAFALKVEQRNRILFVRTTEEVTRSMSEGSELTGAPGQPVDTDALRLDWATNGTFPAPWDWETGTNKEYGPVIEYDLPTPSGKNFSQTQKSEVGGTHSRAMTIAGWQNIVDHCTREVAGA